MKLANFRKQAVPRDTLINLDVKYISDDDTGMYEVGEIDTLDFDEESRQRVKKFVQGDEKRKNELIDYFNRCIDFVEEAYAGGEDSDSDNEIGKISIHERLNRLEERRGEPISQEVLMEYSKKAYTLKDFRKESQITDRMKTIKALSDDELKIKMEDAETLFFNLQYEMQDRNLMGNRGRS